ncbi:hypothetical protein NADFUDRAFT_81386 [Nadsonia fulvescens var. elongata DSM 6958]|uniref:LicD/FKTN/FKRP nucleotidyltransferase domain-containing protein n=1 Tax=Nadsonia fulvescens var. elongata DSM 6958 TaxID=857566 RepID=A0A1E3PSL8_9ASCO|nr:hypothetical protein NADFUDRAFT_81386 [Nadsonia fulvescens var. elongata DSM 6958]
MILPSSKEKLTPSKMESQAFAKKTDPKIYPEKPHSSVLIHFLKSLIWRPARFFRFTIIGKLFLICIFSFIVVYLFNPKITDYITPSAIESTKIKQPYQVGFDSKYGMEKLINDPEHYTFQWRDWVNLTHAYKKSSIVKSYIKRTHIWPFSLFESESYLSYTKAISGIVDTEIEHDIRGKVYLDCCAPKPKNILVLGNQGLDRYIISEETRFTDLLLFGKRPSDKMLYKAIEESKVLMPNPIMSKPAKERQKIDLTYDDFFFDLNKRINIDYSTADIEQKANAAKIRSLVRNAPESPKHFYEVSVKNDRSGMGQHYDWRFFKKIRNVKDKKDSIHHLMRTWFEFAEKEGIISWIAHGSLLGWHWNGMTMTWDDDADVQMSVKELDRFARKYNQTLVVQNPEFGDGRYYIDVSPAYVDRTQGNFNNMIDARFIDVRSGTYLDITGLAYSAGVAYPDNEKEKANVDISAEIFLCKNKHRYTLLDISPLRRTLFEGYPAYVPSRYTKLLKREYKKGITRKGFRGYVFVDNIQNWERNIDCLNLVPNKENSQDEIEEQSFNKTTGELTLFGACQSEEKLKNFHRYKVLTDLHKGEMEAIASGNSTFEFIKDSTPFIRDVPI